MTSASLLTNTNAMTALRTLNATKGNLTQTTDRISTGLRIGGAQDGPASFSIAQTMRGDVAVFKKVSENISLDRSTLGVAHDALTHISDRVNDIKSLVTEAASGARDGTAIQKDIDSIVDEVSGIISGAQFQGVNVLTQDKVYEALTSVSRTADSISGGKIEIAPFKLDDTPLSDLKRVNVDGGTARINATLNWNDGGALAGYYDRISSAVDEAMEVWSDVLKLDEDVDIEIDINVNTAPGSTLASARALGTVDTGEDFGTDDVYKGSVASIIQDDNDITAGSDAEINIFTSNLPQLSFEEGDGGTYDATSIMAHEFGHAIGFSTLNGTAGAASLFDRFVESDGGSGYLFNGDNAVSANGGEKVTLSDTGETGGSVGNAIVHLGEAEWDESLMTPVAEASADMPLSTISEGILQDLGYEVGNSIDASLAALEKVQNSVLDAASSVGAAINRLEGQQDFVQGLTDSLKTGIGQLVDADMAEESARLQALQVQEQLGTQSLAIANSKPQSLLSLFG